MKESRLIQANTETERRMRQNIRNKLFLKDAVSCTVLFIYDLVDIRRYLSEALLLLML